MKKSSAGFTLMELLVVIVLLGIISVLGLSSYRSSQAKSRDFKRKADLRNIALAFEAYYNDKSKYPNSTGGKIMGCSINDAQECVWGAVFSDSNSTVYMQTLSKEPTSARTYYYLVGAGNKSYQLYANLENTQDIDLPRDAENKVRTYTDLNCGLGTTIYCNYGVASQNITPDAGRVIEYQ